jgi:hypothetical protein
LRQDLFYCSDRQQILSIQESDDVRCRKEIQPLRVGVELFGRRNVTKPTSQRRFLGCLRNLAGLDAPGADEKALCLAPDRCPNLLEIR